MSTLNKVLLRIASFFLLFFALGHSVGHFTRHAVADAKAQEVLSAMMNNKFNQFGALRSYDQNYTGMSLNLIFVLIAFSVILIGVSALKTADKKMAIAVLTPILFCVAGFAVTSYFYFFLLPAVSSLAASVLIAAVIVKLIREK